ncbi:hypothetical protein [Novosphingobium sp. Chol11]|uniref:hypothetical protein n=1 Tax=Novosphingobium sp. Chol11 TaxID=1385763 RepID=UPI0025D989FB|nr:hypothetical protein [Novosphingobium sp. Chol11]
MTPTNLAALQTLFALPGAAVAVQAAVSLVLIIGLYYLARAMQLGGDVRIRDAAHARELADAAISGFAAQDIALDRARIGALLRDAGGRVLVVRRHGSHFVARVLPDHASVRLDRQFLTLAAGEPRFGAITLELGPEAQAWAASLRRLGERA